MGCWHRGGGGMACMWMPCSLPEIAPRVQLCQGRKAKTSCPTPDPCEEAISTSGGGCNEFETLDGNCHVLVFQDYLTE